MTFSMSPPTKENMALFLMTYPEDVAALQIKLREVNMHLQRINNDDLYSQQDVTRTQNSIELASEIARLKIQLRHDEALYEIQVREDPTIKITENYVEAKLKANTSLYHTRIEIVDKERELKLRDVPPIFEAYNKEGYDALLQSQSALEIALEKLHNQFKATMALIPLL